MRWLLLLFVGVVCGGQGAPGVVADVGRIDLERAGELFQLAEALSDEDGGALWGRALYGPIMFVDPHSRAIVANARDRRGRLERRGEGMFVGRLPDELGIANTTVRWSGRQWAMIMWPPPPGDSAGALLMHESFHRIQPKLGFALAAPDNHHLDTRDGRLWMRLEFRALAEALEEFEPLTSEALQDALVFRAYRRSLTPSAADEERALELNEGLAEFTGVRLGGAAAPQRTAIAASGLHHHEAADTFVRSFAYATGPAYGVLLDEALPRWPRRVRRIGGYGELLQRAIKFRLPEPLAEAAHARANLYDYDTLLDEENAREEQRRERAAAYRARFVDGPALVLAFTDRHNFTFSPYHLYALDDLGTVYASIHLSSGWGILDAAGGALVVEMTGGRRGVRVPAPAEIAPDETGAISGDGWRLRLAPGWSLEPGLRAGDWTVTAAR